MPSSTTIHGSNNTNINNNNNNNKNGKSDDANGQGSTIGVMPAKMSTVSTSRAALLESRGNAEDLDPKPRGRADRLAHMGNLALTQKRHWPPRLYLAVDCGGTKTAAAICDEAGLLLGRGHGGPANYTDVGLLAFLQSVQQAVSDALARVSRHLLDVPVDVWHPIETKNEQVPIHVYDENGGPSSSSSSSLSSSSKAQYSLSSYLSPHPNLSPKASIVAALEAIRVPGLPENAPRPSFEAAWFGIAGVDSPVDVTTLSPHLADLLSLPYPSPRLIVANDTSLLASPVTDPSRPDIRSGIVVIAGTGSIVMSFRQKNDGLLKVLGRVGGFGWLLGDEGSGYQVGKTAVRKVLDTADRQRLLAYDNDEGEEEEEDNSNDTRDSNGEQREKRNDEADWDGSYPEKGCPTPMSRSNSDESPEEGESMSFATRSGTIKMRKRNGGPPRLSTARKAVSGMDSGHKDAPQYGHMLRDRILQHWSIASTDELLSAVYSDDVSAPPSVINSGSNLLRTSSAAAHKYGDRGADESDVISLSSISASEASANLLPPVAPTLDVESQFRGASPIPSLSSSPTGSTASSSIHDRSPHLTAQGTGRTGRPFVSARSHSESSAREDNHTLRGERQVGERKHRLASLAPLVFHLAFSHDDAMSLDILREQAGHLAKSVAELLKPPSSSRAHLKANESVLCMGGSLVGVERYRQLLVEELAKLGVAFDSVVYVGDPARSGAVALSAVVEKLREGEM